MIMSKLSKFDIQIAISAILNKKRKVFFLENKYHNAVSHVPNFQLFIRSSSFFSALFPSLLWRNLFGTPNIERGTFIYTEYTILQGIGDTSWGRKTMRVLGIIYNTQGGGSKRYGAFLQENLFRRK